MTDSSAGRDALSRNHRNPAWLARSAGVALSLVSVGFVATLAAALGTRGTAALILRLWPVQVALALPYLVVVLAAATTVGAGLAWARGYWSLTARLHQTLLALLGIGFAWKLVALGFLS